MFEQYLGTKVADRPIANLDQDKKDLYRIAQAAVSVELFTIPLYMTTLYSITGMHQVTSQGNDFYQGRLWPGAKAARADEADVETKPDGGNQTAYNLIFSVFIQEMLHLQMAANIATAIGYTPDFNDPALQSSDYAWTCFGADKTVIPNIVDLADTKSFKHVKVDVGPLDENQIDLFLAIELPTDEAEKDIDNNQGRYFPSVPFKAGDWPLWFGSIGWMYQCYKDYLNIRYDNGTTLWENVYNPNGQQNDLFNTFSYPGHPMREFKGFETTVALTDKDIAIGQIFKMMDAITDQGEGSTLKIRLQNMGFAGNDVDINIEKVKEAYRSDKDALISDYPSYDGAGDQLPISADACARYDNDGKDHYHRFQMVKALLKKGVVQTWNQSSKVGNWTPGDLVTKLWNENAASSIPSPKDVATALNALYDEDKSSGTTTNFDKLSQAVVGSIKGVTTVLNSYWNPATPGQTVGFPFPSMGGSGDRMSSCWAIFGKTPNLALGVPDPQKNGIYHACQGLISTGPDAFTASNSCADIKVFHTCRGSNTCMGSGGCGFVQPVGGGGSCSGSKAAAPTGGGSCGSNGCGGSKPQPGGGSCSAILTRTRGGVAPGVGSTGAKANDDPKPSPDDFTAPSNNVCGGYGGCAVPISASQLFPRDGTMDIYSLGRGMCMSFIGNLDFKTGDKVEDIAYQAYKMWGEHKGKTVPEKPQPNALRIALPPST